jgi:DNA-binding IclR family transcriptional regulator
MVKLKTGRSNLVQSIIKGLNILELLDREGALSIAEISEGLQLQKSTVHRLVSTLKHKGYVLQDPVTLKYRNSFKLFEMGNNTVERLGLRREAQALLEELNVKTKETVNLAILDGFHIIYIDKIESPETIRIGLNIGKRLPAYCTGLGKVILAYLKKEKLNKLLQEHPLKRYTKNTICDKDELIKHLEQVRKQGYSIDNEEYIDGLKCIAAPVMNYKGEVVAAISIAIPSIRYGDGGQKIQVMIDQLKQTAGNISERLGWNSNVDF